MIVEVGLAVVEALTMVQKVATRKARRKNQELYENFILKSVVGFIETWDFDGDERTEEKSVVK